MERRKSRIIVTGQITERTRVYTAFKPVAASIIFLPTIQVFSKELGTRHTNLLRQLASYDYLFFTSVNSVKLFSENLKTYHIHMPHSSPDIIAVGPATAHACRRLRWKVVYMPKTFSSSMLQTVGSLKGKKILFPRSTIAPISVVTRMRRERAKVSIIPLYTTRAVLHTAASLHKIFDTIEIDCITFMSASSVRSFSRNFPEGLLRKKVLSIQVVCIGPKTAYTAKRMGFNRITIAKTATLQSMAQAVENILRT